MATKGFTVHDWLAKLVWISRHRVVMIVQLSGITFDQHKSINVWHTQESSVMLYGEHKTENRF